MSPLYEIEKMSNNADNNFIIGCDRDLTNLINDMEQSLEAISKWLKKSSLSPPTNKWDNY